MVFVSMGNEDRFDAIDIINDIRVIWDDIVDPKEVIFWKFDPGIDNDDFILVFDPVGIFPISPSPPMANTPTSSGFKV